MPKNRFASDFNHWLWPDRSFLANTCSQTTCKNDSLHSISPSCIVNKPELFSANFSFPTFTLLQNSGSTSLWSFMCAFQQPFLFRFKLQFLYLSAQPLIFIHLYLQELHRHASPLLDTFRRKQIGIRQLVVAVAEIIDLQATLLDQRVEAEINLAEADAHAFRQISLGKAGVIFQCFEQAVAGSVVGH